MLTAQFHHLDFVSQFTTDTKKSQGTASIGFFSAGPRLLLPSTIERCPLFIAATRPVKQSHTGSAPG
jgi:hypothetical protein